MVEYRTSSDYRPSPLFLKKGSMVLCEEIEKDFVRKDTIDFQALNRIGLKYGVFSTGLYNKPERVRTRRNRVHLQSFSEKDYRYTKRDIEYVFSVTEGLPDFLPGV